MAGRDRPEAGRPGSTSGQVSHYPVGYSGGPGSTDLFPRGTGGDGQGGYSPFDGIDPGGHDRGPRRRPGGAGTGGTGGSWRIIDYPRRGRTGWRHWVPSWKLVSGLVLTGFLALILLFAVAYATIDVPKNAAPLPQTTVFYYADGKTEMGRLATENRENVDITQIPADVQHAVVASEDRSFYTNKGVSPTGIIRAAWSNAHGNATQGGSTITQQYVKNTYKMQEHRTITSKFREFFIALKIDKAMKKDDVLEDYLNTIYFGRGAYGIQAASQAYFHRDVGKLNVSQAAYLAGIINAPSFADNPTGDKSDLARATFRWNVVLNAMAQENWITPGQRQAITKFPRVYPPSRLDSLKGQRGYLVKMAQQEAAKDLGVTVDAIETGGYQITTTFKTGLVDDAVQAVKQTMPSSTPKGVHIGLAAIDPQTGAVLAIYGGKDYLKSQFNQATQASAQGGSTFKAFTLLAALKKDVSLYSVYNGASPQIISGHKFENFGNENPGYQNLLYATQQSTNTIFVQLNRDVGKANTLKAATDAGLPASAHMEANLSNVLGTANPHPIDMATAYGTFASQGVRHTPYSVKAIAAVGTGRKLWPQGGNTLGDPTTVFTKDVMAKLTYALQKPIQGGTGAYALSLGRPAAGKTGTSSNNISAWFVGYTPQISVAVMMYQNGTGKKAGKPIPMRAFGGFSSITGGSFPVRIWTAFTKSALEGKPIEQFPTPDLGGGDVLGTPPPTQAPQPATTATQPANPTPTTPTAPSPTTPPITLPTLGVGRGNGQTTGQ